MTKEILDLISILFVIGQLGIGGAERQLVYLASHLIKQQYKVLVCSLTDNAPLKTKLNEAGVEVVIIPPVMKPDLTRPFKLYKLVKTYQPDVIHSYLFVANTWSRVVGSIAKLPVILTERSSNPEQPLYQHIINKGLRFLGNGLIANSKDGADRIIKTKTFNPERVYVIHNGIPVEKFSQKIDQDKLNELRHYFGITTNNKVIGVIGRLSREKNHDLLFKSFINIRRIIPNAKILCIGEGPRRAELDNYVSALGIADSVIFTGNRQDIPECLSIMDVLALPSRWEGSPNVILEAMAASVPIVATDVGGVKEVVTDGKTGYLVPPDNPQLFAEKIIDIIRNPENAENFTKEGRMRVAQHFSIEKMVSQTEEIYKKIVSHE